MSIKIGDLVLTTKGMILSDKSTVLQTGLKFIVNDIKITKCKCSTNNEWTYIWLGHYRDKEMNFSCGTCKHTNLMDKKLWVNHNYYKKLDPNKEFSTKYGMQIQLMRLLIAKDITPEAYHKLIGMTEGDSELLELGTQIMNKLATHEI